MQNALAEQPVRHDTLGGTTTISLRATPPGAPGLGISEIEVISEVPHKSSPINEADAIFCRDLLEFVGDFRSAAPKSSNVRRLGQAAATGTAGARDPALGPDALFDFLRAYEAAPKMRPLSNHRPAQERAVKNLGPTVAQEIAEQPEDTPFRVPPYVSAVPENTAIEEALFDPEAVWPAPQPSPVPGEPPGGAPLPVVQVPVEVLVTEPPAPRPLAPAPPAQRPTRAPAATRPASLPVAKRSDPMPVSQGAAPVAGAAKLVLTPIGTGPDAKPASAQVKKRPEPRTTPVPAAKPLGPAAARAKAISEGLIDSAPARQGT